MGAVYSSGGDSVYESPQCGSHLDWVHTNPDTQGIISIAVLPGGNTIYISTGGSFASSSNVYVSVNDGSTWTQHNLPVTGAVQEVDIDPNDHTGGTTVAVMNTFATGQVYRTTNGGTSWTNISGNLPVSCRPGRPRSIPTPTRPSIYPMRSASIPLPARIAPGPQSEPGCLTRRECTWN